MRSRKHLVHQSSAIALTLDQIRDKCRASKKAQQARRSMLPKEQHKKSSPGGHGAGTAIRNQRRWRVRAGTVLW